MTERRVQSEAFLETRSRAMMMMGHGEVHLLVRGRHVHMWSALSCRPDRRRCHAILALFQSDVLCHRHLLGVLLRRWMFEPAGWRVFFP